MNPKTKIISIIFFILTTVSGNGYCSNQPSLSSNWIFMMLIGLVGGLALFVYGMNLTSEGLQKVAGKNLRLILEKLTNNRVLGVLVGTGTTVLTQSSGATTVMLVSLTASGLITLQQSIGIILGADIGTTFTVQLIAVRFSDFALLFVAVGILLNILGKMRRTRSIGRIILGFGLIFYGMKIMSESMAPLNQYPEFVDTLRDWGKYPLLAVLISTIFTGIIHASAATIGLIIAFAMQGMINLETAIPLMLGANIGTCFLAFLGSIGISRLGKQVAVAHTGIKVLGVILCLLVLDPFIQVVKLTSSDIPRQIANAHTIFNLGITFLFIWFVKPFTEIVKLVLPVREEEKPFAPMYLDERVVLETSTFALAQAKREILREGEIVQKMFENSIEIFTGTDIDTLKKLRAEDEKVDILHTATVSYLTKLGQGILDNEESKIEIGLLYITDDLESIGDVVDKNIIPLARKMLENKLTFSEEGWEDIKNIHSRVTQNLASVLIALKNGDKGLAQKVVDMKQEINEQESELRKKHIERLHLGLQESIETSGVHLDLIDQYKRINSHVASIGFTIVEEL